MGYAIYDINRRCDAELIGLLRAVPHTIVVREAGCRLVASFGYRVSHEYSQFVALGSEFNEEIQCVD